MAITKRGLDVLESESYFRSSVDWPQLRSTTLARASRATSLVGAAQLLAGVLGQLGDHHGFVWVNHDLRFAAPSPPRDSSWNVVLSSDHWQSNTYGHVGYIEVDGVEVDPSSYSAPGQNDPVAAGIQQEIARVDTNSTCGWMVDLRRNGGGNMYPMVAGLGPVLGSGPAGSFVGPGETSSRDSWSYAGGQAFDAGQALDTVDAPYSLENSNPFVAVLTSPVTTSSGEVLTISFKGRPKTRSFGLPTAGFTTANATFDLGYNVQLVAATSIEADRDGHIYDGPVSPDEQVPFQPRQIGTPDDPVIAAARRWLASEGCS